MRPLSLGKHMEEAERARRALSRTGRAGVSPSPSDPSRWTWLARYGTREEVLWLQLTTGHL